MTEMITILGPTASGKTTLGVAVASALNTEIISADSRQIYRGMDLGTGKDLEEYTLDGTTVPYHLIDIRDAGYKYNVYEFQHDFWDAYKSVKEKGLLPVLCGGTGMYIEAVLKGYRLLNVPENKELRERLASKTRTELEEILKTYKTLHNVSDTDTVKRAIREIEIQEFYKRHEAVGTDVPPIDSLIVGVDIDRELRREKISQRLKKRFEEGMLDEVQSLLDRGIPPEDLIYYGLEYKFMTMHLTGQITAEEMYIGLETAIHQFAKRQMTWFRGMERRGFRIHWLDAALPLPEKVARVLQWLNETKNIQ